MFLLIYIFFLQISEDEGEGDIVNIDDLEFNIINTSASSQPAPAEPEPAKEQQQSTFTSLWKYF